MNRLVNKVKREIKAIISVERNGVSSIGVSRGMVTTTAVIVGLRKQNLELARQNQVKYSGI